MAVYITPSDMEKLIRDADVFYRSRKRIFHDKESITADQARERLNGILQTGDDPYIACALGCLYYDAEYTEGRPDADSAFRVFVSAAAGGVNYAKLKMAEIYSDGQGGRESPRTARDLIQSAYDGSLDIFSLGGSADDFAESALRLGRAYAEGVGLAKNPREAYKYFLEARMASESMEQGQQLREQAERALEETRKKMQQNIFSEYIAGEFPWFIKYMLEDGSLIDITVRQEEDGDMELTVRRTGRNGEEARPMLMTFPEISCSILSNTLIVRAAEPKTTFSGGDVIAADDMVWHYPERILEFCRQGKVTGRIACREFRVYPQDTADRPQPRPVEFE